MRKYTLIGFVTVVMLLSAVSLTSLAQTSCNSTDTVIASTNADCVTDSGVGVGLTKAQESKIITAANLFGTRFDGDNPAGVCLQGEGALYVSRSASNPRQAFFAWYYVTPEGFTCTNIDSPATVVLIAGDSPFAPGQAPEVSLNADSDNADADTTPAAPNTTTTISGGTFNLNNCTVVTRAILNFRDAPSINSDVLDLIPYRTILKVIDRDTNWFNVIFGDQNGWVAASLVNTRGRCG